MLIFLIYINVLLKTTKANKRTLLYKHKSQATSGGGLFIRSVPNATTSNLFSDSKTNKQISNIQQNVANNVKNGMKREH